MLPETEMPQRGNKHETETETKNDRMGVSHGVRAGYMGQHMMLYPDMGLKLPCRTGLYGVIGVIIDSEIIINLIELPTHGTELCRQHNLAVGVLESRM